MNKNIYRFMSFESFVDLVMRKQISLVHPTLWDDPKELSVYQKACNEDDVVDDAISLLQYKTYAQSWSELSESDAMWRIYSYGNMSVRVETNIDYFASIKNIDVRKVIYTDNIDEKIKECKQNRDFIQLLAIKRKVFEHEKEIRIISRYKYKDDDDVKKHLEAFWILKDKYFKREEYSKINIVEESNKLINYDLRDKIFDVPIDVSKMITNVMLNPFAPDWFDNTVALFCEQYDIHYLGKSLIYDK